MHSGRGKFSQFVIGRLDAKIDKLNLSDSQQEKYEEIKSNIKARAEVIGNERKDVFSKIKEEFSKENPDMGETLTYLRETSRSGPDLMGELLDYFEEFYAILDEEQKAKFTGMVKDLLSKPRMKKRRGFWM